MNFRQWPEVEDFVVVCKSLKKLMCVRNFCEIALNVIMSISFFIQKIVT